MPRDPVAGFAPTGEGNDARPFIRNQALAQLAAADHHLDSVFIRAASMEMLDEAQCAERRLRMRFQDDRTAGRESGAELVRNQIEWIIIGRDGDHQSSGPVDPPADTPRTRGNLIERHDRAADPLRLFRG